MRINLLLDISIIGNLISLAGISGKSRSPVLPAVLLIIVSILYLSGTAEAARDGYLYAYAEIDYNGLDCIAANDINDYGDIIATYMINGVQTTFIWDRSKAVPGPGESDPWEEVILGVPNPNFIGQALNKSWSVVGYEPGEESVFAWIADWDDDLSRFTATYLDTGSAVDIDDKGMVVGFLLDENGDLYAWQSGQYSVELPLNREFWEAGSAYGVKFGGIKKPRSIVGVARNLITGIDHAIMWRYQVDRWVFTVIDAWATVDEVALKVNENGWAAGYREGISGTSAMIWPGDNESNDSVNIPEFMKIARDINKFNEVVGDQHLCYVDVAQIPREITLLDLAEYTALPADIESIEVFGINDKGEIVGIATKRDTGSRRAFILVPYDINNNSVPDYREIIEDSSLDENNNWTLDWAEVFRTGVYSVGSYLNNAQDIENVQIMRLTMTQETIANASDNELLSDDFHITINTFGYSPKQRELILSLRTKIFPSRPDSSYEYGSKYDYVPYKEGDDNLLGNERWQEQILADIVCSTGQIARNVDYIQVGNEFISANSMGEYYILKGQLVDYPTVEGPVSRIKDGVIFQAALEFIVDWLRLQADAVRQGSALAGRPLRIISPDILQVMLNTASLAENGSKNPVAKKVKASFELFNEYADITATQFHWKEDQIDFHNDIPRILDWLSNANNDSWLYLEDVEPRLIGCTEWGPFASFGSDSWIELYGEELNKYYTGSTPNPIISYDDFILENWLNDSKDNCPPADMHAPELLDWLSGANLAFACFGSHMMVGEENMPSPFDPTALFCNKMKEVYIAENGFSTHIRAVYEDDSVSGSHVIDDEVFGIFHPRAQEELESCDD